MSLLTTENPVFVAYALAASVMVLKIMAQGWMTVYRMQRAGWSGLASPEDLRKGIINRDPQPEQLQPNDDVDRSRRMHRNDLENIPAFLAIGLVFVTVAPPYMLAIILFWGFVLARLCHTLAYATKQSHEIRATFYTVGSVAVMVMAGWVIASLMI